jgi:hypothetical protein
LSFAIEKTSQMRVDDDRLADPAAAAFGLQIAVFCRSWLASEAGLEPCTAIEDAFAGKPAPTANSINVVGGPSALHDQPGEFSR